MEILRDLLYQSNICLKIIIFVIGVFFWGWFVFFFPAKIHKEKVSYERNQEEIKASLAKPVVEFKINFKKILTIENKGTIDIENIRIFLTTYTLDKDLFGHGELKIKEHNKIGGAVKVISLLEANGGIEKIDLSLLPSVKFYDNPGKEDNTPLLTYYCLRITFQKTITKEKYVYYTITTAYKNFPSFIENQENTASAGGDSVNFLLNVPKILKEDQLKRYNDDNFVLISSD